MQNILKIEKINFDIANLDEPNLGDAGIDLKASGTWVVNMDSEKQELVQEEYEIKPNERILVKTGIKVQIPPMFWGNIRDRSGLAFKHGIHTLAGVIDETYRGEIGIVLVNLGTSSYTMKKNERIAQMVITPYIPMKLEYVESLEETKRQENGFGSSGK